jgi:hypothetical protein
VAVKTVACPECGASVPYGRLSCAECGSLLASVVGSPRRLESRPIDDEPPALEPDTETRPEAAPLEARAEPDVASEPDVAREAEAAHEAQAAVERDADTSEPEPPAPVGRLAPQWPTPPVLRDWEGAPPPTAMQPAQPATLPAAPVSPPVSPGPARPVAGTYLAPTGAWVPQTELPTTGAARDLRPGEAPLLADLPFDAPDELPGWLVVAGGALTSVSFLLPWATQLVIGGTLGRGYFDRWGLASPAAIILLAAALTTFILGIVPNPVPAWLRTGLLPLIVGGVLLGLVWAYLIGPFGPAIGVWTVALGALLFVIGGILALHPWHNARHDSDGPSV